MSNFKFKQFNIQQQQTAMKVGTDAVVLGCLASVAGESFLDVGTGTGILALMAAQRNANLYITAIEPEQGAYEDALLNFTASPWSNRISLINSTFSAFKPEIKYDIIWANPPYFEHTFPIAAKARSLARGGEHFSMADFMVKSLSFSHDKSVLCIIYPYQYLNFLLYQGQLNQWYPAQLIHIKNDYNSPKKRTVVIFNKENLETTAQQELVLFENKERLKTATWAALSAPFYL